MRMEPGQKDDFLRLWEKYFPGAELPLTFYFAEDPGDAGRPGPEGVHRCVVCALGTARRNGSLALRADEIGCAGGRRYLGFSQDIRSGFEHFLSCGIPGIMKGERYKKSPGTVRKLMKLVPSFQAPGKYIVFKRWDHLAKADRPEVVVFFAPPDILTGLFMLAGFDRADEEGVRAPFCSGCGAVVMYPWMEREADRPEGILGMFDPSARPCVSPDTLTIAFPMSRFAAMVADMEESFLTTSTWENLTRRFGRGGEA